MFGGNSTLAEDFFLYVSRRICRTKQKGRLLSRPFVDHLLAPQALTIGPLETGPLVPPPPPLFGPPFGGLRLKCKPIADGPKRRLANFCAFIPYA